MQHHTVLQMSSKLCRSQEQSNQMRWRKHRGIECHALGSQTFVPAPVEVDVHLGKALARFLSQLSEAAD
jgi:hypothetical protein